MQHAFCHLDSTPYYLHSPARLPFTDLLSSHAQRRAARATGALRRLPRAHLTRLKRLRALPPSPRCQPGLCHFSPHLPQQQLPTRITRFLPRWRPACRRADSPVTTGYPSRWHPFRSPHPLHHAGFCRTPLGSTFTRTRTDERAHCRFGAHQHRTTPPACGGFAAMVPSRHCLRGGLLPLALPAARPYMLAAGCPGRRWTPDAAPHLTRTPLPRYYR